MLANRPRHYFNFVLLGAVMVLLCFGVAMVYSTTIGQSGTFELSLSSPFGRHMLSIGIGLVLMAILTATDYHLLAAFALPLYLVMLTLLVLVLMIGEERNGCKCWLGGGSLQPSEVAKMLMIVALAAFWTRREDQRGSWGSFFGSLLILGVPLGLIMQQPDLGTMMVIAGTWLVMAWVAGTRLLQIGAVFAVFIPSAILAWDYLKPYQQLRLLTFLDPEKYASDAGWQVIQSLNAIGSGGMWGHGLNQGIQSQRNFLPVQSSDFIFAVVGEELGFVGSTLLLVMLITVIWQSWNIASRARDSFGRLVSIGFGGMLLVHTLENTGMTMSLMPMTGIPLPFISAGGSFMMMTLAMIGVIQSIALRKEAFSLL